MAYENMTYEVILQRMMNRVVEKYPNLDTREGSIIFNALAPAAVELAIMYTELDNTLNESFVATASREYLLMACEQMGIDTSMFEAKAGIHDAIFDAQVPIGSRWNCDLYNYTVIEYVGVVGGLFGPEYYYKLRCETPGSAPNDQMGGQLTPITDIQINVNLAQLSSVSVEGEDEASDDDIRKAYFNYIKSITSDGNVAQYQLWCEEFEGVGRAKIIPQWNGTNTVKVSILNSSNRAADYPLIMKFQEYLDPNSEGMGNGVAPIGAMVTVTTATERTIPISATIRWNSTPNNAALDEALTEYFAKIAYNQSVVGYYNIASVLINVEGVASVSNLYIDGLMDKDLGLAFEEIPVLGKTTWTVA